MLMYKLEQLSHDKIIELKSILEESTTGNQSYLNYLDTITSGLTTHSRGRGNTDIIHLSPKVNNKLSLFLLKNLSIKTHDIISTHVINYHEGSCALPHKDSNSTKTVLILLDAADVGGELELENEIVPFKNVGDVISYNGGEVVHGVTEIIKGYRRTLVVWIHERSTI